MLVFFSVNQKIWTTVKIRKNACMIAIRQTVNNWTIVPNMTLYFSPKILSAVLVEAWTWSKQKTVSCCISITLPSHMGTLTPGALFSSLFQRSSVVSLISVVLVAVRKCCYPSKYIWREELPFRVCLIYHCFEIHMFTRCSCNT